MWHDVLIGPYLDVHGDHLSWLAGVDAPVLPPQVFAVPVLTISQAKDGNLTFSLTHHSTGCPAGGTSCKCLPLELERKLAFHVPDWSKLIGGAV